VREFGFFVLLIKIKKRRKTMNNVIIRRIRWTAISHRPLLLASQAFVVLIACAVALPASSSPAPGPLRIVHQVKVGGPDNSNFWCQPENKKPHPGCDGNFSLVATQWSDGTVTGEYIDQFAQGDGGIHAVLDCLVVEGNTAWVSGHVISGGAPSGADREDWTGWAIATVVRDNTGLDPQSPDQISYTWYQGPTPPPNWAAPDPSDPWAPPCTEKPAWYLDFLTDMPKGQVKIR